MWASLVPVICAVSILTTGCRGGDAQIERNPQLVGVWQNIDGFHRSLYSFNVDGTVDFWSPSQEWTREWSTNGGQVAYQTSGGISIMHNFGVDRDTLAMTSTTGTTRIFTRFEGQIGDHAITGTWNRIDNTSQRRVFIFGRGESNGTLTQRTYVRGQQPIVITGTWAINDEQWYDRLVMTLGEETTTSGQFNVHQTFMSINMPNSTSFNRGEGENPHVIMGTWEIVSGLNRTISSFNLSSLNEANRGSFSERRYVNNVLSGTSTGTWAIEGNQLTITMSGVAPNIFNLTFEGDDIMNARSTQNNQNFRYVRIS